MLRPQLQIALHHLEPLPKAELTIRKIRESFRFIDENKNITVWELPSKWVKFWRVRDEERLDNLAEFTIIDDANCCPDLFISLTIFGYLYVSYYRGKDFADFHNYLNVYTDFQRILLNLSGMKSVQRSLLPPLRLFDLENLSCILDELNAIERMDKRL